MRRTSLRPTTRRFAPALALVTALLFPATPLRAATAQEMLNAPVWYLEYTVTLTSTHSGGYDRNGGKVSFTSTLTRVTSDRKSFNVRSQGPGALSMMEMAAGATGGGAAADAQRLQTEMLSQMDNMANWIVGGATMDPGGTDADVAKDTTPSSPSRIDYQHVENGVGLVDETGAKYDYTRTTTIRGEGMVLIMGLGAMTLEMNTAKKTYSVTLPSGAAPTGPGVVREEVYAHRAEGQQPTESRESEEQRIDFPSGLSLVMPQQNGMQGGVVIRGTLDPASGKIAGEQSFPATYTDGAEKIPATLVFKYVLTTTPPKQ
jgi:hypothetical protein